jgi:hypothetical protein
MLTQGQQTTLDNIKFSLSNLVESYNKCMDLINKIERIGNDPDFGLTAAQVSVLITRYMDLRQGIVERALALYAIGTTPAY